MDPYLVVDDERQPPSHSPHSLHDTPTASVCLHPSSADATRAEKALLSSSAHLSINAPFAYALPFAAQRHSHVLGKLYIHGETLPVYAPYPHTNAHALVEPLHPGGVGVKEIAGAGVAISSGCS
jgi:hypothetical protein